MPPDLIQRHLDAGLAADQAARELRRQRWELRLRRVRWLLGAVWQAQPWLERLTVAVGVVACVVAFVLGHTAAVLIPFVTLGMLFGVVIGGGALADALQALARRIEQDARGEGVEL